MHDELFIPKQANAERSARILAKAMQWWLSDREPAPLRMRLIGMGHRIKARVLHAVGGHTYRLRWTGPSPRCTARCTWCGYVGGPDRPHAE